VPAVSSHGEPRDRPDDGGTRHSTQPLGTAGRRLMSRGLPAGGAAIRSFAEAQDLWRVHTGASGLFRISARHESPLLRVYAAGENSRMPQETDRRCRTPI